MATPSRGVRKGRGGPVINYPLFEIEWAGFTSACWLWRRKIGVGGYGIRHRKGFSTCMAHKQLWMMVNGSVPIGLELDHLCRNRHCVRPDHLEPVTRKENVRRGLSKKYADAHFEAAVADALLIGVKPAARLHKVGHAHLRNSMKRRGLKSPLPTGCPKKVNA
jgi:hypothetical protein